ncbi:hypothetical protein [Leptospira interrogans]|uniref:hypothetical protein n=1 Tax=Leptospira interrogans TaxID=173 RepID=UPI0007741412|nr:hypothetical protein [Leptospira interrogans]
MRLKKKILYRNAGILSALVYGIRDGDSNKMDSKKDLLPNELISLIYKELCLNMKKNEDLELVAKSIALVSWHWILQNRE